MNAIHNRYHSNLIKSNKDGLQDIDMIVSHYGYNFVPDGLLIKYLLPCISKKLSSPKSLASERYENSKFQMKVLRIWEKNVNSNSKRKVNASKEISREYSCSIPYHYLRSLYQIHLHWNHLTLAWCLAIFSSQPEAKMTIIYTRSDDVIKNSEGKK